MISTSTQGSVTKHVDYSKAFSVKFAEFIGFSIKIVQLSYTAVGYVVLFFFVSLTFQIILHLLSVRLLMRFAHVPLKMVFRPYIEIENRRYLAEILPIRRKPLSNQSINQINSKIFT